MWWMCCLSIGLFCVRHVCHGLLKLLDVPARTNLFVSLPVGVVGFIIFIWVNRDNDFKGWERKGWRTRDDDENDVS